LEQPTWITERQRANQHGVYYAEDGCVGGDSEHDCEDDGDRKQGRAVHSADGISEIVH